MLLKTQSQGCNVRFSPYFLKTLPGDLRSAQPIPQLTTPVTVQLPSTWHVSGPPESPFWIILTKIETEISQPNLGPTWHVSIPPTRYPAHKFLLEFITRQVYFAKLLFSMRVDIPQANLTAVFETLVISSYLRKSCEQAMCYRWQKFGRIYKLVNVFAHKICTANLK